MATVRTFLVRGTPMEPAEVPTWIYVVSIAAGTLILVFIVLGLVKVTFLFMIIFENSFLSPVVQSGPKKWYSFQYAFYM